MAMYLVQGARRTVNPNLSSAGVSIASSSPSTTTATQSPAPEQRTKTGYNVTAAKLAGKWECKGCQHINKDSFSRCWACGSFRSNASGGMYMCQGEGCSTVNNRMEGRCTGCATPFTGASNWVCTACSHENTRKDLSCLNCKISQPLSWSCVSCGCETTCVFADSCRQCKEPRPVPKVKVSLPVCLNCGTKNHKSAMRCTVCLATNSPTTFGPEESFKGYVAKDSLPVKHDISHPVQLITTTAPHTTTSPPAPEPQPIPPVVSKPSNATISSKYKWKCKHCSSESDETVTRCRKCGKLHHPPVFKATVVNRWLCRGCNKIWPSRVNKCISCNMDRLKSDLKCGCSLCGASRQPLGEACSGCNRTVAPSYNCGRCARLTPLNEDNQCVWCSFTFAPSQKVYCTSCGEESAHVRCTTCTKYGASHKWVCSCLSINPSSITSCEVCDGPMEKAILKVPSTWKCEGCSFVWSSESPVCRNSKCSKEGGGAYGRSYPNPIKCHECGKMSKWDSSGECEHCSMNLWPRGGKATIVRLAGSIERQSGVVVVGSDDSALNSFLEEDTKVTKTSTKYSDDESILAELTEDDTAPRDDNPRASKLETGGESDAQAPSPTKGLKAKDSKKTSKAKQKKRSSSYPAVVDTQGTTCGLCGHRNQASGGDCAKCGLPF